MERTFAWTRMDIRVSMSYGDEVDQRLAWEAVGRIDLAAGTSRLLFYTGDGDCFRERYVSDSQIYERLTPHSGTWRRVREEQPNEASLTNDLYGICRLMRAVSRWNGSERTALTDGTRATLYRADLRRRLGHYWNGAVPLVFVDTLLPAIIRRRQLYAWRYPAAHVSDC
jgi:hypothetical protein